jgi:WD40 repeat protein
VWDLKTRQAKTTLTSKMGPVYQVAFSPDGKMLAMAERNGLRSLQVSHRIRLADAQTGEEKGTLLGHAGAIYGLAFSPDGMFVVSAGRDRLLQIWQVPTMSRRAVRDLNGYHKGKVTFSRRGDRLAVAGFSGAATPHATVWGLRYALEAEPRYPHFDPFDVEILRGRTAARIERLAFSSDGKSLALFSREAGTWIYDTATWSGRRLRGSTLLQVAAFSPDLSRAAVLGKTLSIWNLTNPREILDLQDPAREVYRVTFSPDGRYLFSAHQYAELKVRDVRGREVAAPTLPPEAVPTCIAVSSDGSRIAAGGALFSGDEASKDRAGPVCIWDMKRPEKPNGLKTFFHGDTVYDVALSSDGSLVASMGQKGVVKIWEIAHGKDPWTCPGYLAAFAPDGSVLATTGTGKERTSVVLWDTKTHAKLRTLTGGHFLGVNVLSFSPHGNRLASGGSDGLVTVWNPQTGKEDWTPAK